MNYWILLDIVLIAIFLGCVYLVARNGLVKSLAFFLACALAALGSYGLTSWTWHWGADKIFTPVCEKIITAALGDPEESSRYEFLDSVVTTAESALVKIKEKFFPAQEEANASQGENENASQEEKDLSSIEKISALVGKYTSMILLFWIYFALFLAVLRIFIEELSFVNRIPVIGFSNQLLGLIAGILVGYLVLAAPIYLIEKVLGGLDLVDAGNLTSSAVINYIMRTLG